MTAKANKIENIREMLNDDSDYKENSTQNISPTNFKTRTLKVKGDDNSSLASASKMKFAARFNKGSE